VGMMLGMYKNTVFCEEAEPPSTVRVAMHSESAADLLVQSRRLGDMGVKVIVFPDDDMLSTWRYRIAALAK
jgi:hypothetical protein